MNMRKDVLTPESLKQGSCFCYIVHIWSGKFWFHIAILRARPKKCLPLVQFDPDEDQVLRLDYILVHWAVSCDTSRY